MIFLLRHPSKWFNWKRGPRNKQWWRWSRLVFESVLSRVMGIIIFFLQVAGQIHAQKVKDMNCHLAKLTTPMICQVPKILQKGEDDKLHDTHLRFQSGFVPLWPWGISPSWDTPTWGWPPVQLRRGSFSSPQRSVDCFNLWTIKL